MDPEQVTVTSLSPRASRILHLGALIIVDVCLGAAIFAGTFGARALQHLYPNLPLPAVTELAVLGSAALLMLVLSLSLLVAARRGYRSPWLAFFSIALAGLILATVAVGITFRYATTTFQLSPG